MSRVSSARVRPSMFGQDTYYLKDGLRAEAEQAEQAEQDWIVPREGFAVTEAGRNMTRRARLRKYLIDSTFGMCIDYTSSLFSIVGCALFILGTYFEDREPQFRAVDLFLTSFFLFELLLRLYSAELVLAFLLKFEAFIDIVTILPVIVEFAYQNLGDGEGTTVVQNGDLIGFLRFVRVLRILRILRLHRMFAYFDSEVKRATAMFVLKLISLSLITSATVFTLENMYRQSMHLPDLQFHDAFYFTLVTVSTVGYGDIKVETGIGKVFTTFVILFSLIYIPMSTNELLKTISEKSSYGVKRFKPAGTTVWSRHVLVCGEIHADGARQFLREFFHPDHGSNVDVHVIFLMEEPPSTDLRAVIESQRYELVTTFLQGSVYSTVDLDRARARDASVCFILASKFSPDPQQTDTDSLLKAMSLKQFIRKERGRDIKICIQLIRPENRERYLRTFGVNGADPHNVDKQDVVVCVDQIKMHVMAKSCLCPGFATIMANLVVSSDESRFKNRKCPAWVSEYRSGGTFEIYRSELSPVLRNVSFEDLAASVYEETQTLVIGLEIHSLGGKGKRSAFGRQSSTSSVGSMGSTASGGGGGGAARSGVKSGKSYCSEDDHCSEKPARGAVRLLLNPVGFVIPSVDECLVHAIVIAKDEEAANINKLLLSDNAQGSKFGSAFYLARGNSALKMGGTSKGAYQARGSGAGLMARIANESRARKGKQPSSSGLASIGRAVSSLGTLEEDEQHSGAFAPKGPAASSAPNPGGAPAVSLAQATIRTRLAFEQPHICNHIVYTGANINLPPFVELLRNPARGGCSRRIPIVILNLEPPPPDVWRAIADKDLFYVEGSPLDAYDLRRAGVEFARSAVVSAWEMEASGELGAPDAVESDLHSDLGVLTDADAIFAHQGIKRINPTIEIMTEVINSHNIVFLDKRTHAFGKPYSRPAELDSATSPDDAAVLSRSSSDLAGAARSPASMRRDLDQTTALLASGCVFSVSLLDALLCQSFYNPQILNVISQLVAGEPCEPVVDELSQDITQGVKNSLVYRIQVPTAFRNKPYGELFGHLLRDGRMLSLGLWRGLNARRLGLSEAGNRHPYVVTNPPADTVLRPTDWVYVLSQEEPEAGHQDGATAMASMVANIAKAPAAAAAKLKSTALPPLNSSGKELPTIPLLPSELAIDSLDSGKLSIQPDA